MPPTSVTTAVSFLVGENLSLSRGLAVNSKPRIQGLSLPNRILQVSVYLASLKIKHKTK